ncbi:MAG: NUDIX domain-containing protein [Acidimicrobiia bacterium]|nr:NUDIX domain-containing protein [Acidimicrobiia bacterium]MDH3397076.1 NUDIX domain-containing protein [Acidimicrobiia bacterium]MDH5615154.1 NUDIX domain-containing protein [Acidimicrobiia bacterium]
MTLDDARFMEVIDRTPLVSIDLVVVDPDQHVLCGWRVNQPARGFWFVPGGRILKGETLDDAFRRIAGSELGHGEWSRSDGRLLGVFEHLYDTNFADVPDISTHYVVLAYRLDVKTRPTPPDVQHSKYAWWSKSAAATDPVGPTIHPNTAAYFEFV